MSYLAAILLFMLIGGGAAFDCAIAQEVFFLNGSDGNHYTISRSAFWRSRT
jgi:hypothetical protein